MGVERGSQESISDLHEDIATPLISHEAKVGEYDDYPHRVSHEELSPITRIEQFVGKDTLGALQQSGIDLRKLTEAQYGELVRAATEANGDTIVGSVFDKYILPGVADSNNPPTVFEREKNTIEMASNYKRWGFEAILRGNDIKPGKFNFLLSIEGMDFVNEPSQVKQLLSQGVRLFGPQYGHDNPIASVEEGLTPLGREVINKILDSNSSVDLAHSSPKTRADIISLAQEKGAGHLLAYTHGSSPEDVQPDWAARMEKRVITLPEIKKIVQLGGIIGFGVTYPFFKSAKGIAQRIYDTCQLENGINSIAIGTDFGGVPNVLLMDEMRNKRDVARVISDMLSTKFNLSDEQVNSILRNNVTEWAKRSLA